MIVIIDYKLNNLISIYNSVKNLEKNTIISSNKEDILNASKLILPGVGTYYEGMKNLKKLDLVDVILKRVEEDKIPILGICLGMQLLSSNGVEVQESEGLNLIKGCVKLLPSDDNSILPHVGWNEIVFKKDNNIFNGILNKKDFYFVHSYHFLPDSQDNILASSKHGKEFVSIINKDNIYGFQFHPEKSGKIGLKILENFLKL